MYGSHYHDGYGPSFFPVVSAPNVVIIHLWTGIRTFSGGPTTVNSDLPIGVGFDETYPAQLQQVWSQQQWQSFITTCNSIVSKGIGSMFKNRYLFTLGPVLALIVLMVIGMVLSITTDAFFIAPMLLFPAFLAVGGLLIWNAIRTKRRILSVMEELGAHCHIANQASPGVQWSVKSMQMRRSTAVWLQGELQMHPTSGMHGNPVAAAPAGAFPPPPPAAPYAYPPPPAMGTPLSMGTAAASSDTTAAAALWPVTAGGTKATEDLGAESNQQEKPSVGLEWPV